MTCPPFFLPPDFSIERDLLDRGHEFIAGVDEAGRGALAGPLALGLVIFHRDLLLGPLPGPLACIRDSKQLRPVERAAAADIIRHWCLCCDVAMVSHKIIDKKNINGATEFALTRLISGISIRPDVVIMDGNFSFSVPVSFISVKKGDCRSISIAAASIIAKVARDAIMEKLDVKYPGYGLARHKGYGTAAHCEAIRKLGYAPIHRKSYEPVKSMAANRSGDSGEN
jgi:ribonuclease HII